MNNIPPQKPTANITIDMTTEVLCACGSNKFKQVLLARSISPLLMPTQDGKPTILQIPVLACDSCSAIQVTLLPDEIQQVLSKSASGTKPKLSLI
jgi:hypothetical protein